jgi:hypothetical protein
VTHTVTVPRCEQEIQRLAKQNYRHKDNEAKYKKLIFMANFLFFDIRKFKLRVIRQEANGKRQAKKNFTVSGNKG